MDGADTESKLESDRQEEREEDNTGDRRADRQKAKVNKQRVRAAECKQMETNRQRSKYAKLD